MNKLFNINKSLFAVHPIFDKMFNPAHESNYPDYDWWTYGSRRNLSTDGAFNGEYFRSRTDNQYFAVVRKDKNIKLDDIIKGKRIGDFRDINYSVKFLKDTDPNLDDHIILRLEFTKNKTYFVESYQSVTVSNPDVTIINMPLDELLAITPKFKELPQDG